MAVRWQVVKGCVPVEVCNSIEEATRCYMKYECDEIRRIENEDMPLIVTPRSKEPNPIWDDKKPVLPRDILTV